MKEFDHTGLLLAEYQGKLFEKSTELNCSSAVFFEDFYKDYEDGIVEISFVYRLRNSLAHNGNNDLRFFPIGEGNQEVSRIKTSLMTQ